MTTTSLHDKTISNEILTMPEVTFYAVFLALISMADSDNLSKLEQAFPEVVMEAKIRYYAPGGALTVDEWLTYYKDRGENDPPSREFLESRFAGARTKAAGLYADGTTPGERDKNLDRHNQR